MATSFLLRRVERLCSGRVLGLVFLTVAESLRVVKFLSEQKYKGQAFLIGGVNFGSMTRQVSTLTLGVCSCFLWRTSLSSSSTKTFRGESSTSFLPTVKAVGATRSETSTPFT